MEGRGRTINPALTRPETVAGAEKMPLGIVVTVGVLFLMMAWWFQSLVGLATGMTMLFIGVPLVRRIAKADPQMFGVYKANLKYRTFYSARSPAHLAEPDDDAKKSWAGTVGTIALVLLGVAWLFGSVTLAVIAVAAGAIGIPVARKSARQGA